ncbi:MAG: phenylacetic acid degradation protein PaaN [Actinomycetes bacterium]
MSETQIASSPADLVDRHRELLDRAMQAVRERTYWSAYPEHPKAYGGEAMPAAETAFQALLGSPFELDTPGATDTVGGERSPYGIELGVTYPHVTDLDALLAAARSGMPAWRDAGPAARAAVCAEVLARINARSFELAHAVMHTTGQAFMMAFQAAGPHAQDRALEAVAYALAEMTKLPSTARWEKPQGKRDPIVLDLRYTVVPRGVALVVGCSTFPTWNGYPGLFASLVTGNAVVVKPHPRAVLPLAISVQVAREVLAEAGFDPNLVTLAPEALGEGLAKTLAVRPEIKIIDFTGSTAFGVWLEDTATQALVYTEKAGVNTVVIDSTDDYAGMLANLAFSLSLYSGQMCTAPQNFLLPRDGIPTDAGPKSADEVAQDLAAAVDHLLDDPARGVEITGALVSDDVRERADGAGSHGTVVREASPLAHPRFADATIRTPAIIKVDAADSEAYLTECFGPVAFMITTDSTVQSLQVLHDGVAEHGGLTASIYSTDERVLARAEEVALQIGVLLSENLTGGVYVNQTAAFSDLHGTGFNPAANSAYTDAAFVTNRFRVVEFRRPA